MYSCGPTVYHYPHLGNLRTYISTDLLRRALKLNGFKVTQVMNITDVGHLTSNSDTGEDKMEKGAKREGKSVWEIAEFYTKDFWDSIDKLNIEHPTKVTKATEYINEMINLIKKLEEKGYTYQIQDGIYFDTSRLKEYGELARLDKKGLKAGARVEVVQGKKNLTDFALWKLTPPGVKRQMEWDSPWGKGFPGWHIECSAMSMKILGETLDIHSGGVDHIPVHHTNEIAQSEAATGKQFAKYWVHFAHMMVDRIKMSKSLGNFYLKQDLEKKGYDLLDFRYLTFNTHYRSTMNFTWIALEGARNARKRLMEYMTDIKDNSVEINDNFMDAINDDLNIPQALAILWETIENRKYSQALYMDQVLGLGLNKKSETDIPSEITELITKREQLRIEKKWSEADKVRMQIEEKGFEVKDTKDGSRIKKL